MEDLDIKAGFPNLQESQRNVGNYAKQIKKEKRKLLKIDANREIHDLKAMIHLTFSRL